MGQRRKLYVFVMVLGYSRMMHAHFTTSTKLPVLLGCLTRAFRVLGIPAELLVDNMKQAVDRHDASPARCRGTASFLTSPSTTASYLWRVRPTGLG